MDSTSDSPNWDTPAVHIPHAAPLFAPERARRCAVPEGVGVMTGAELAASPLHLA
jgi:hypothetical protein